MGQFGLPPDRVAYLVLGLSCLLWLLASSPKRRERWRAFAERHYRIALLTLAVTAAALSMGYEIFYLRGGPRIIDATAYLLEARAFAAGHWTIPPMDPATAQRGRFLLYAPELHRLSVLFPPGYPAVLAVAVLLGSPLALGPVLAAALTWLTAKFAERIFQDRITALLAASLSATNACLRYHTADTMSHGLSALLVCLSLYGALGRGRRDALMAGASLGWLAATRPMTALAVGLAITVHFALTRRQRREVAWFGLGLIPGLCLWFGYQWSTTGSPWQSTQLAYYATADGPPGCFRYGFGKGIGCLFEHGSYVARRLPNGFGIRQALYVTLLRLRWHSLDVMNFEPLAAVLLFALARAFRRAQTRPLVITVLLLVCAYLPFYFDASYPGGGARLYADALPLEHVLIAGFVTSLALARVLLPLSLAGFALHGAYEHRQLMTRDGGRPMFEATVLRAHGVDHGIVFVDTDHGFFLGHSPADHDPSRVPLVVRKHGDAHDRVLWERLGRPPAYDYRYDPLKQDSRPSVAPIAPDTLLRYEWFEAEAQWPPLSVEKGWVLPVYPPNDCTSGQRGLSLEPVASEARTTLELPIERTGRYRLLVDWVARRSGRQQARLSVGNRRLVVDRDALGHQCFETVLDDLTLESGTTQLTVETGERGIVLDRYRIVPL